ncbi:hypothetical protein ALC56_02127 [Trachymyrmex septentrionalis]|uniref:Uncharacterized protein n=1 Tax=Trachymyrmex septentrionalis TaxID=34720 RepID=A0A195FSI3_9HYME|nr:hypothetical protein ALC56_02127 [Trachymyrmex septentrionalis]
MRMGEGKETRSMATHATLSQSSRFICARHLKGEQVASETEESGGQDKNERVGGEGGQGWHRDREQQNERKRLTARVRAGGRKTVIPERIEIERGWEGGGMRERERERERKSERRGLWMDLSCTAPS